MTKVTMAEFEEDLLDELGFDDWREFAIAFGNWADQKDFTYKSSLYDPAQGATLEKLMQQFITEVKVEG
jgi:hypothetical protein